MYARIAVLFLLLGAAQQGLAASAPSSNNIGYSYDVYDVIKIAADVIPRLGFANGLRGIENCKIVVQSVFKGFSEIFSNLFGFKDDASLAFSHYKECDSVKDANRTKVCKEAVRLEYIDSVRQRARFVFEALKQTVGAAFKVPFCIFNKP